MIIVGVLALAFAVALARGGRIARLADADIRLFPLLFLPLALQALLYAPLPGAQAVSADTLTGILHITTFGIAALVVCANVRQAGFPLLLLGLLANLAVIIANGGYMPVYAPAREIAGLPPLSGPRNNVIPMSDATALWFLGDFFPLPSFIPLAQVYSVGDVLIALGLFWFIQSATRGNAERAVRTSS